MSRDNRVCVCGEYDLDFGILHHPCYGVCMGVILLKLSYKCVHFRESKHETGLEGVTWHTYNIMCVIVFNANKFYIWFDFVKTYLIYNIIIWKMRVGNNTESEVYLYI